MNISIITATDNNYKELSSISRINVEKYCNKNGFDYSLYILDGTFDRPSAWLKIVAILDKLQNENSDYVLWIDCDATIIKQDFDLKGLFASGKEIYIAQEDWNGLNTGVMAFKNTKKVIDILKNVWSMTEYINHIWWEQAAIQELYKKDYEGINSITEFVPHNILNAYECALYGMDRPDIEVCKDSFIVHFCGLPLNTKIEFIKKYTDA